ncbi:MAG TPA: hypothetical protein VGX76_04215 [Pirellulales bacterium]|nr:hypothetical protein [Pirellulales bacterium]
MAIDKDLPQSTVPLQLPANVFLGSSLGFDPENHEDIRRQFGIARQLDAHRRAWKKFRRYARVTEDRGNDHSKNVNYCAHFWLYQLYVSKKATVVPGTHAYFSGNVGGPFECQQNQFLLETP